MSTRRTAIPAIAAILAVTAVLATFAAVAAQESKPKPGAAPVANTPPDFAPPKPTAHHEHLAKEAGTWDATVEEAGPPGTPPTTSKGVETNTMVPGGLWMISKFKGSLMGVPFEGNGLFGYDPETRKYNGYWTDSMITRGMVMEGTCDATGRIRTMTGMGVGPAGPTPYTMVSELTGPDTKRFTLSVPGPEGKPMTVVTINYKRRK